MHLHKAVLWITALIVLLAVAATVAITWHRHERSRVLIGSVQIHLPGNAPVS